MSYGSPETLEPPLEASTPETVSGAAGTNMVRRVVAAAATLGLWAVGLSALQGHAQNTRVAEVEEYVAPHASSTTSSYKDHSYGTGSSATMKHTWPATDPVAFSAFMLAYFPTTPWLVGNESWVDDNCATWGKVLVGNMTDATFQLHTVWAPVRPSGGLDVATMESQFSTVVDAAIEEGRWTPLLDYSVGLYTQDLDFYVTRLDCGGVKYLPVQWTQSSGDMAYSLMVHVPGTLAVLELMGTSLSAVSPSLTVDAPRLQGTLPPSAAVTDAALRNRPQLYATRISYATSMLSDVASFYSDVLQTEELANWAGQVWGFKGKSRVKMFKYSLDSSSKLIEVHYWEHKSSNDDTRLQVAGLESAMNAAHSATHKSVTDGFDQWLDWHYGHRLGQSGAILDDFVSAADAAGVTYNIFTDYSSESNSWTYYMYVASPGGTAVQVVGNFSTAAAVPDGLRVFDTCSFEGGFTLTSKSEVAASFADRTYENHPNYNTLAKKLEHSQLAADLDECQA